MRLKSLLALLFGAILAGAASGQTKVSGEMKCGIAEPRNMIEVGDRPGHLYGIGKTACTWTKPLEMGGLATKDGSSTAFSDVSGDKSSDRGHHFGAMVNGDRYFVRFQGASKSDKGVVQSQQGTWSFAGGTGKLKGLQGKGTYTSTGNAEGTTVEIEGEYKLP